MEDTTSPPKFHTTHKFGKKRALKQHLRDLAMMKKQKKISQPESTTSTTSIIDSSSSDINFFCVFLNILLF